MAANGDSRPVGLFDSGVGGLSVLQAVRRLLPHEDLVYFADQKNCPYGPRPPEEIRELSRRVAQFLIARGAKALVVACNTASAAALDDLRAAFDVPIVGMEPAVKPAAQNSHTRTIGVLATSGTFRGDLFQKTREAYAGNVRVLTLYPTDWVERVERGDVDSAETEASVRRALEPLLEANADEIALGCTHYPFLIPVIQKVVGTRVALIDPSEAVARQTERVLRAADLMNQQAAVGRREYYTSGDPAAFARVLYKLTGEKAVVHPAP